MPYYFGIDVGATNVRCLVTTEHLESVAEVSRPTAQGPTVDAFTAGIDAAIEATLAESGVAPGEIAGVGIAAFGPLDADSGIIAETPNLDADLADVPLRETVAAHFADETPVVLLNDAVAGAVAEHRDGDDANVVYLTLSSGIGAGVVVDDTVLHGRDGNAAEVGHFVLDPDSDRRCGCGKTGHWEGFASGENIPAYALELREEEVIETALPTTREALTASAIFDAAGDDPLATAVVDRVGRWNALGVVNLVHAFAPDRVAVGGGVALNNPEAVLDPIRECVGDYLMVDAPEIHLTEFGDDVVVTGAVLAAIREASQAD